MSKGTENDAFLDVIETLLRAQLKAIKDLRAKGNLKLDASTDEVSPMSKDKRMSHMSMAYEVLLKAGQPLHVLEIVRQIQSAFGITVYRDTLVSAMIKKVAQGKQFVKTGKNMFGLLGRDEP